MEILESNNKNQLKSHEIFKSGVLDSYRYPRSFFHRWRKSENEGEGSFLSSGQTFQLMRQWIRICPGRWCLEVKRKNKKVKQEKGW